MRKWHIQLLIDKESHDDLEWNFETFCKKGYIEFLDVEEEEGSMIAMNVSDVCGAETKTY